MASSPTTTTQTSSSSSSSCCSFNKSRLQQIKEIAVCFSIVAWFPVIVPLAIIYFFSLLFTPFYLVPLLYIAWCIYDKDTPYRQGRPAYVRKWARNLAGWRHFANYFPVSLHKTADLDPSGCYILVHHPHAILGLANFANFLTNGTGTDDKYPGITFSSLTLDINFKYPLLRELSLALGIGSVSAESIIYKMTKAGPGQAVSIVVGGAAEAGLADNDDPYRLKLQNRKGFVRMALKTGASMVPVFTFGEMDIFTIVKATPGSTLDKFQKFMHQKLLFYPVVFYGILGFLPYRKPMHTVVGAPIKVPKIDEPSEEEVDRFHKIYIEAIQKLFDENVAKYGDPTKKLQLL